MFIQLKIGGKQPENQIKLESNGGEMVQLGGEMDKEVICCICGFKGKNGTLHDCVPGLTGMIAELREENEKLREKLAKAKQANSGPVFHINMSKEVIDKFVDGMMEEQKREADKIAEENGGRVEIFDKKKDGGVK
jgi:hypothetical protein